jgi:hypothetical protein
MHIVYQLAQMSTGNYTADGETLIVSTLMYYVVFMHLCGLFHGPTPALCSISIHVFRSLWGLIAII